LKRIYDQENYYERARKFLARYRPEYHPRRVFSDYRALVRSFIKQGVFSEGRSSYWKFIFDAATRYRHAFGTAITLAVMGYHFQKITERVCRADYLPQLPAGELEPLPDS
jgi:hypothetical protein